MTKEQIAIADLQRHMRGMNGYAPPHDADFIDALPTEPEKKPLVECAGCQRMMLPSTAVYSADSNLFRCLACHAAHADGLDKIAQAELEKVDPAMVYAEDNADAERRGYAEAADEKVERFRQSSLYRAFTPDPFAVPPLALDAGDWVENQVNGFKMNMPSEDIAGTLRTILIAFGRQCVEHAQEEMIAGPVMVALIQAKVDAAVKAEREACAKIAMRLRFSEEKTIEVCCQITDAIRARK